MNYFQERKRKSFANENLEHTSITIKQNISLRKNDLNEKIYRKRINYTNISYDCILQINPDFLKLNEEQKNYEFDQMVF